VTERTALSDIDTDPEDTQQALNEPSENNHEIESEDTRQRIFATQCEDVMAAFTEVCQKHGVVLELALISDPESKEPRPMIMFHGHPYDAAEIMARTLKDLKSQLYAGLNTEPA